MTIINNKKWVVNILLRSIRKKSLLETHYRSVMDTALSLERVHQDDSNITMKGYTTTPKEVAHAVKATTQKDNKKTIIMKCASHTYI